MNNWTETYYEWRDDALNFIRGLNKVLDDYFCWITGYDFKPLVRSG